MPPPRRLLRVELTEAGGEYVVRTDTFETLALPALIDASRRMIETVAESAYRDVLAVRQQGASDRELATALGEALSEFHWAVERALATAANEPNGRYS
jgi:hypothetical protein